MRLGMEFKGEVKAGALILISSAIEWVGRTSRTLVHRRMDAEENRLLSTMRSVSVYFDLANLRAIELPASIRQAAKARLDPELILECSNHV